MSFCTAVSWCLLRNGLAGKITFQMQEIYGAILHDSPKAGIGMLVTDQVNCFAHTDVVDRVCTTG